MPCGRRQSYNVNPSNKKDNSFKLFITFLLAVLLVYLVIYALIVTFTKLKNNDALYIRNQSRESLDINFQENEEVASTKPIIENSKILLYQKATSEESTKTSNNDKEQLYTTTTEISNETPTEVPIIELESATTKNENSEETSTSSTNKQENPILIAIESTYLAATKLLTSTTDKTITEEICQRPDCKKMAIDLLKNINFSIDPCEDFYQFSCGNTEFKSEDFDVLFEEIENPKNHEGVRSFGGFFNSCLDDYTNQFDTIKQVLSLNIRSSNLTTLLGFLLLRQSTPLFEIIDGRDGEIQILPPNSYDTDILENWSLKTHIDKHCLTSRNLDDYKQCQSKTLNKMLKNLHSFKSNNEKPMTDFDFLINVIIKQQIPTINIQEALFKKSCQQVDIPQLNKNYPIIDWQILLSTISETQNSICIYFKKEYLDPIMSDLNVRMSKNELEVLNSIKDYFQLQLYQNLIFQRNSEFCMNQAVALMPEIAEKIFQKYVFNNERFEKMFEEVKAKFNWLIEVSKLKEVDKMLFKNQLKLLKIEFNTNKFAVEKYHDYTNDDYLTKLFMLLEVKRSKGKNTIVTKKVDLVNDTIIVIPYSFIYKTTTRPDFHIKFHISRAIAKYFHQQNINNSLYQEFQKSLNTNLENKLDGGLLKENWSKLVPASTLERTVDNLALQVAFESYFAGNVNTRKLPWISEVYTDQQQFFLGIGQDICESSLPQPRIIEETKNLPAKFRLDAMLTNSQNFAKSFSCPEGSTMNPADEKIEFDQFEFEEEYDFIE